MGKITKTMQPKHEETLSPWLRDFVQSASSTPLPLLPERLTTFPTRWPFPRGDLYHWIPLLNRFDNILETFASTYGLAEGPQARELGCDVLLQRGRSSATEGTEVWDMERLRKQGYGSDGDRQLIEAVLKFTRVLLEHCGNRSIYASSSHLNDLLNTTCLSLIIATLEVGSELAKRYQASVKRIGNHSRHVSTALLSNHYNIELDRVQHLASPFVKTPLVSLSEASVSGTPRSAKSKEKVQATAQKNAAAMFANDLGAVASADTARWKGWGDVKVSYSLPSPARDAPREAPTPSTSERTPSSSNAPSTPTPLRRSTTMGGPTQQTPRSARQAASEESPSSVIRSPAMPSEQARPNSKVFDLPEAIVASSSIHDLLKRCPADLPALSKYEVLSRLRVAKALLGDAQSRQQALAVRLLAITNLAYIHQEATFMEKVMRPDIDETRRFQLVYQLAELIHPSADGTTPVPLWLQAIALALLEAISTFQARYQDVLSALNANVNHGILLYVIRRAVAGMKEDDPREQSNQNNQTTEVDDWRKELFSLTQHLAMSTRIGAEMVSAGLMEVLVDILKIRTNVAQRNQSTILSFIDGLIWSYQNAFQAFFNGDGLDAISDLLVTSVNDAKQLTESGRGTKPDLHSSVVDYDIPFNQQQTLKWLLKFMHHMMTNSYSIGGNTDRLLRNLVDKSDLLAGLREIMLHTRRFGSVLWTNSVTVLSDFINNDPTSYAAIAESRMIVGFLESVTNRPVPEQPAPQQGNDQPPQDDADGSQNPDDQVTLEPDNKPHPPPEDVLAAQHDRPLAQGILANPDAILIVPHLFNSISLNNAGLKMVVSSGAFDTFFEIFESPKHVSALEGDLRLASGIGESFDELSRHHPALRNPISDAVIDMVARIKYLGKVKARSAGWGAKLVLADTAGNMVAADDVLPNRLADSSAPAKGKAKASGDDTDVEMTDGAQSASQGEPAKKESASASDGPAGFDAYVHALSLFLSAYLSNNTLKSHFIQRGGLELLLDIAESPSLALSFNDSGVSRKLSSVITQLVDHSPVLGLPSLLKRAQAAIDTLKPLIDSTGDKRPYFESFLAEQAVTADAAKAWDSNVHDRIMSGTKMVKALMTLQFYLKTLFDCVTSAPRSNTVALYPINVFDYYLHLVKSLGPLLKAVLTEEGRMYDVLPQHWWPETHPSKLYEAPSAIDLAKPADPSTTGAPEGTDAMPVDNTGVAAAAATPAKATEPGKTEKARDPAASAPKKPTKQEELTARFKNYETLRVLLHSLFPFTFPFLQQLGRTLFPRRERDPYSRQRHIDLAKAVAACVLDQLRSSIDEENPSMNDRHQWIVLLHTLGEIMIDTSPRSSDRSGGVQISTPVYVAFIHQGGFDVLTTLAQRCATKLQKDIEGDNPDRLCSVVLKRILDIFATCVDGKTMNEATAQYGLLARSSERSSERRDPSLIAQQLILEARIAIFPVVREIWDAPFMEKEHPDTLHKVIDILKIISIGDNEPSQSKPIVPEILKKTVTPFNWALSQAVITQLTREYDADLSGEAAFRANGNQNAASEYCRMHQTGKAGSRNPVPSEDAFFNPALMAPRSSASQEGPVPPQPSQPSQPSEPIQPSQTTQPSAAGPEPMALDAPPPQLENLIMGELEERSSNRESDDEDEDEDDDDEDDEDEDDDDDEGTHQQASVPPNNESNTQNDTETRTTTTKQDLDNLRENLRKEIISRSLDIVRAHPKSAIEVSELISAVVLHRPDAEVREEVGITLTSAITSLSSDGGNVESEADGRTIAAYAHLFALLLRENAFLVCNLDTLKANVGAYIGFLKVSLANSKDDLPPWIPFVLLIVEMLLSNDEKPVEASWKAPTSENDTAKPAVIQKEDPVFSDTQQSDLLDHILDLLPRLGKDDALGISILRVLVILTRKRSLARRVGEKKNLQRLFVMAKQLAGASSNPLKDSKTAGCIMNILRHVVEDEETIKQVMRAEIRGLFENPQRSQRNLDVNTYLRNLAPVALRAPDLFVEVTNEMTKLVRWSPASEGTNRSHLLALKEPDFTPEPGEDKDTSVEPAVQATEDLSLHDIKQSTETGDKDMTDAPNKPAIQRPVVENPDGVVHFLLCELLNYREVDDKETAPPPKDSKDAKASSSAASASSLPKDTTAETPGAPAEPKESKDNKDKKPSKFTFKAEEHPIFIYRCFLLNCLSELLQSYNRTKVEFINFKRSAPLQTNTPVKPRSSVLNYLIHDLLCYSGQADGTDTVLSKKKAATSAQAQQVLVSLVSRTGEKVVDRHRERFEYDDDPDLLFVRKFALDTVLKAYERASYPDEPLEVRYAKMQCLAELMNHIIGEKDRDPPGTVRGMDSPQSRSQAQLRRMMYEKGYLDKLTASIADLDLAQAGVKRAIKSVLRVFRVLTDTAKELSRSSVIPFTALPESADDEIISTSSISDMDDDREETPDLYRNSALGMLEPRGSDDESDEEDDDEEMYDDEYGDELDYDDEGISEDDENRLSDDDDEELGEMGEIEGLHGEPGVVEVVMDDDDDEDMEDEDDMSDDDDDDLNSEDMEEMDDHVEVVEEIVDEDGNPMDDDGASGWESETDDDEEDEDEDIDYEAEAGLEEAHHHLHSMEPGDIIGNLARAVMDPEDDFAEPEDMDDLNDHFIDDGRPDDDEDDDDDDEDMDEDEYIYDEDYPHDEPVPVNVPGHLGWDTLVVEPFPHGHGHRHRHHGHRSPFPPGFIAGGHRDPLGDFRSYFSRGPRSGGGPPNNADDGINPLLRRNNQNADPAPPPRGGPGLVGLPWPPEMLMPGAGRPGGFFDSPIALLNDIVASLPVMRSGPPVRLQLSQSGGRGELREYHIGGRESRNDGRRDGVYHEPSQAVAFSPESTFSRYQEEARMVFGGPQCVEKAQKLLNLILSKLVPPALEYEKKLKAEEEERRRIREEERKKREDEERRAREAKEAEEKAEREKKEAEERAERERAAAEAPAPAQAEGQTRAGDAGERGEPQAMEGVESHAPSNEAPAANVPRVVTTIRGEEVDITELGIDPEYLAALPEEFREEVIAQTVSSRRSQAREDAAAGEQTEVFQEFLDALPEDIRTEIVQQERQEIRRRERDEQRRQAAPPGQDPIPADMDAASILLTFPPDLRHQVLLEQGEDIMDQLPPDMAAQVRLTTQRPADGRTPPGAGRRSAQQQGETQEQENKAQRKTVIQMLDKAGIATLLRLMFISQYGSIRNYLFSVLADVCENRQNRLEVISTVLLILQEGSTDMDAVERSFSQLSLKAKRPKDKDADPKTPQNLKRTLTSLTSVNNLQTNSEVSPLLVVHQCLDLLQDLSTKNPHIPMLFLTEHEAVGSSLKRSLSRKGKSKDPKDLKDSKAQKYAINSLLSLLDRDLVMESSAVMAYLADLLNKITVPLATMERRRKDAAEKAAVEAKKASEEDTTTVAAASTEQPTNEQGTAAAAANTDINAQTTPAQAAQSTQATQTETATSQPPAGDKQGDKQGETKSSSANDLTQKKDRQMQVPVIPSHNLTLVVKIFVARECSSKTFQNTISAIKNLSAIPGAKAVFGQELVRQARLLSENIVSDLDELLPHILKATSGTEIQGVALSKFSPGASEQNKLLRVLTALDHLFDTKKKNDNSEDETSNEKQDLVHSLYDNSTFSKMWEKLSACLSAIRQRENMVNVATILLPLIESLMVVCKNTASTESNNQPQSDKEMLLSSPPPEDRMAGLFFSFTEDHRRILNELVRNNPKLMSGTFALLVKNPKVLEFDNKRNYFNRSVHSRAGTQRPSFPSLQLAVRREHVFHDSFRSLYFKTGDEMKYGKLNIRFHGEEGVDAGGVTREWFQVLARQMFDANYALFIPVSSDRTTFHPNKLSGINDMHLMYFKFVGRIIGKALYEGRLLDCYFSRAVYKRILSKSVSVKDMESFDPDYYKSLVWMLENDITDIITETFSVEDDEFGVTNTVDLCPNGRNIPVTDDNKQDYVRMVVEHKLLSSVKEQMEHFLKGFHEIIPSELISIFNEQELELLISGLPDIDIDDWKSNTEYQNYNPSSQQIQWFWRAVRSFDKEERAKLLQFVTGTSKVPLNGFKELEGMNGINRFNIHRDYGNKDRLPSSHTCFNQLDLPEYESYEALRTQLMKAITAGSDYFGFA